MKPLLAFSGAYLFTLTIIHLLPEALVLSPRQGHRIGYFILAGFFGQLLLEVFSQGVEHGHIHHHTSHAGRVPFFLLFSLVIHSFLEGSILVRTPALNTSTTQNFYAILTGIALHHIPAAFALMAALLLRLGSFNRALPYLILFALAAPFGIVVSNYVVLSELLQGGWYAALLGLVAGNFLHVSTTILFETSPEHRLNLPKLAATLVGTLLALAADWV
ncbi:ZIP family metal transporter [Hymenobacter sp. GOD-10R]|uniref:ZIP family metal transporter n=1 Tax=Hymenobacter sp. GOD-10R TaxID=3093922 RepID=UPI002D7A16DD|nr:ZIP family metal transporter [Hymenobacter sp. GOD-10R]WRQ28740.1 ZIP family metal transporter [Hymenobacter sp. GOD-10R]